MYVRVSTITQNNFLYIGFLSTTNKHKSVPDNYHPHKRQLQGIIFTSVCLSFTSRHLKNWCS